MFEMHRWLLDSKRPADGSIWWGKTIVGIATLAMLIIFGDRLIIVVASLPQSLAQKPVDTVAQRMA